MPPVECGQHVLDYLYRWGPVLSGTMGQAALTHDNLVACQYNTGVELSEWEASTIIRLSREFLSESNAASKPDREPPFESADAERLQARRMEANLDAFFG